MQPPIQLSPGWLSPQENIMSLRSLGNIAVGYSKAMDTLAVQGTQDKNLVKDAGKLAQFQIQMFYAQSGFQLTSRSIQDIHREDQILSEMLRDA
jgi:hypothetical protein